MSQLPLVIVTDLIVEPLDCERRVLDGFAEVAALDIKQQSELTDQIDQADAVMVYHYLKLTRDHISRLQNCKIIMRPGVGYDNIDIAAAREYGIPVCNVPDYGTEEVADSAVSMAVTLARGSYLLNNRLRRGLGDWTVSQATPIPRLRERVFGIIGCGRIGTAAALRAKAYGFDVLFFDPYVPDGIDKSLGIRRVHSLEELLQHCHILSMHCPLTEETRGMIGYSELKMLPKGAILVNTARGGVVDTEAVIRFLESGHLYGAGIDVLELEPPDEECLVLRAWRDPSHPAYDRLLLNPHSAYYCEEGCDEFRTKGAMEILRALKGEPLRNCVN